MEVLVLGGDLRYIEIIENLSKKHNVDIVGYKNTFINHKCMNVDIMDVDVSKYDVILFPINGVMDKNLISCRFNNTPIKLPVDFLVNSKKDVLIFSGINTSNLNNMLDIASRKCEFLMNDLDVIKDNAVITVEGIIADIIVNTDRAIGDSKVLVFGYGNVGKVLVDYLSLLGANVCVSVVLEEDKKNLISKNIDCFYSYDHDRLIKEIGVNDVIVNTVPKTIIDEHDIKYINQDSYVLDISSHPHGINREVLDEYFIKNKLYLGIPGKVASKTAGNILTKKINQIMKGK